MDSTINCQYASLNDLLNDFIEKSQKAPNQLTELFKCQYKHWNVDVISSWGISSLRLQVLSEDPGAWSNDPSFNFKATFAPHHTAHRWHIDRSISTNYTNGNSFTVLLFKDVERLFKERNLDEEVFLRGCVYPPPSNSSIFDIVTVCTWIGFCSAYGTYCVVRKILNEKNPSRAVKKNIRQLAALVSVTFLSFGLAGYSIHSMLNAPPSNKPPLEICI